MTRTRDAADRSTGSSALIDGLASMAFGRALAGIVMSGATLKSTPKAAPKPARKMAVRVALCMAVVTATAATAASADEADVVDAVATPLGDGRYRIDVSVLHADEGWDHYADRWDVISPDGTVLGSRELAHPHENEQPFTRSLTLVIPDGIERVTLSANDSVHGGGGVTLEIELPR